jgi:hypothetical protein
MAERYPDELGPNADGCRRRALFLVVVGRVATGDVVVNYRAYR